MEDKAKSNDLLGHIPYDILNNNGPWMVLLFFILVGLLGFLFCWCTYQCCMLAVKDRQCREAFSSYREIGMKWQLQRDAIPSTSRSDSELKDIARTSKESEGAHDSTMVHLVSGRSCYYSAM